MHQKPENPAQINGDVSMHAYMFYRYNFFFADVHSEIIINYHYLVIFNSSAREKIYDVHTIIMVSSDVY